MYSTFLASRTEGLKWPKVVTVAKTRILQTRSTRRMKRLAYKASRTLRRIQKLLARQAAQAANLGVRRSVRELKAAKRLPHQRVRSMDEWNASTCADPYTLYRNASGTVTGPGYYPIGYTARWGVRKAIVDSVPILKLAPPRSPVTIGSVRQNSLQASVYHKPTELSRPIQVMPKSKWPARGLYGIGIDIAVPQPVAFDMLQANKALQKAIAKVYQADIQANEYIIEWRQVAKLLRDPLRTVLVFHKVLEKWTRRDSWIWIPSRRYQKFGKGTSVSKTPAGGVLMSMRTRREVSASTVSKEVLNAACNRWLQYRYGIAPIMSDLTAVYGLWLEPTSAPRLRSCSARHWVQKPTKVISTYYVRIGPFATYHKRTKTVGEFYSAKVWFDLAVDQVPTSYKYGMHPTQWLNVLWNGIPYSFVADWVINLDEWLTSQRHVPWIQLRGNVVTRKVFENARSICDTVKEVNYGAICQISGSPMATIHRESIHRRVDLPRTMEPFLSAAWSSAKNAMTAAALILSPVLSESLLQNRSKGK